MGLLQQGISILHFDETYYAQKELQKIPHEEIDFQHLEQVHLYCDHHSLAEIGNRLQRRTNKGITFIGSGNYHYVTYVLLQEVAEPFTLILFDHHPDLGMGESEEEPLFSCGSWVYYALRDLPLLQKAVIIGPTYEKLPTHPRATIYPFDGIHNDTIYSILREIPTNQIYISIDKDVLRTKDAITNWDQGKMSIDTLTRQLSYLVKHKDVSGLDVCGEIRFSHAEQLHQELLKNDQANVQILQSVANVSLNPIGV